MAVCELCGDEMIHGDYDFSDICINCLEDSDY